MLTCSLYTHNIDRPPSFLARQYHSAENQTLWMEQRIDSYTISKTLQDCCYYSQQNTLLGNRRDYYIGYNRARFVNCLSFFQVSPSLFALFIHACLPAFWLNVAGLLLSIIDEILSKGYNLAYRNSECQEQLMDQEKLKGENKRVEKENKRAEKEKSEIWATKRDDLLERDELKQDLNRLEDKNSQLRQENSELKRFEKRFEEEFIKSQNTYNRLMSAQSIIQEWHRETERNESRIDCLIKYYDKVKNIRGVLAQFSDNSIESLWITILQITTIVELEPWEIQN